MRLTDAFDSAPAHAIPAAYQRPSRASTHTAQHRDGMGTCMGIERLCLGNECSEAAAGGIPYCCRRDPVQVKTASGELLLLLLAKARLAELA